MGRWSRGGLGGCLAMVTALAIGLLGILFLVSRLAGFPLPIVDVEFFGVGGQPGHGPGGGPGAAVTATPHPSPTATPVATPRVTPVPTPSATPPPTPGGGGGGGQVPPISSRTITGGHVQAKVSGLFSVDADVAINTGSSSAGEFETWLYYGTTDLQTVRVGIFLGEPPYVQVSSGTFTAQSKGAECAMQVNVTSSSISGHVSCTGVTAYDLSVGSTGTVNIELDFSAGS